MISHWCSMAEFLDSLISWRLSAFTGVCMGFMLQDTLLVAAEMPIKSSFERHQQESTASSTSAAITKGIGSIVNADAITFQQQHRHVQEMLGDRLSQGAGSRIEGNPTSVDLTARVNREHHHQQRQLQTGPDWNIIGGKIDGEAAEDAFGRSVSMNAAGDRVAIGAPFNDGTGSNAGHVRVYQYVASAWVQLGLDIDGEAVGDFSGWSVSMNAVGDIVAIGAYGNDGTASDAGHVRVFQYVASAWVQLGSDIDGEAEEDHSGSSVSMNAAGDRVAIGASNNDGTGLDAGHVRVYQYVASAWVQLGSDIDGKVKYDFSGRSVSMNKAGDIVAVGALLYDDTGFDAGHVRMYQYVALLFSWVQLGSDIDGEADDFTGSSVSMNAAGDIVAIGAPLTALETGHVRVYQYVASAWVQLGSDIDGEDVYNQSGYSVSMNAAGDRVAIGAPGTGIEASHVRVYQYVASAWVQQGSEIYGEAQGDSFGISVSMNAAGDIVAVGTHPNSYYETASDTGYVRVYQIILPSVTPSSAPTSMPTPSSVPTTMPTNEHCALVNPLITENDPDFCAYMDAPNRLTSDDATSFDTMDLDGNGIISLEEMAAIQEGVEVCDFLQFVEIPLNQYEAAIQAQITAALTDCGAADGELVHVKLTG